MSNDIDKDETMSNDLNDQHTGDQHTDGDIESLEFSVEYDDAGSFGEAPAQPAAGTAQDDTDKAAKPAVDTDANATATSANASHVDQTMRLAKARTQARPMPQPNAPTPPRTIVLTGRCATACCSSRTPRSH